MKKNSSAAVRLSAEYRSLVFQPVSEFVAAPFEDDVFQWHFIIKGQKGSAFEGGIYHGKIIFNQDYPSTPPDLYFLTPNGRFETETKIPNVWKPSMDIPTALPSVIAFMATPSKDSIGGIDETDEVRRELAIKSREFTCNECSLKIEPDDIPNFENESQQNIENENNKNDNCNNDNLNDKIEEKAEEVEDASIQDEKEDSFFEEFMNIGLDESTENVQNKDNENDNANNNNSNDNNNGNEDQNQPQMVNIGIQTDNVIRIKYDDLVNLAKKNRTEFFPYLDIPIVIIFIFIFIFVCSTSI